MRMHWCLLWLATVAFCVDGYPQKPRMDIEDMVQTVYESSGTITSNGYPNGYETQDSDNWKFRVSGALYYEITFTAFDLDSGCYDYITIYDDTNYIAPGNTLCDMPSSPIIVSSSKITVTFQTASDFIAGPRGAGFSFNYVAHGNVAPTPDSSSTTNVPTSTTPGATNEPPTTTVAPPASTTNPPITNPPTGGNFPSGTQDDHNCGNPHVKPQITGFDYEAQGAAVSGYQLPNSKVVNGEAAVPHSWPWQVTLQGSYGGVYCGGTLVREQWVVTAAHCGNIIFVGTYGSDQVGLGMHDRRLDENSRQLIDVVQVRIHPQYDNPDRSHDVALVKLATPATLNEYVSLACEAHEGWTFPAGMQCVVSGWGVTVEGGNRVTDILQQAPLPLLSDQECYTLYQQANLDTTPDMQCAGGQGKGACNGDSGGPLNCYVNNRWYHMGIVSFGEASCDTEIAGVFARVAELRGFIDSVLDE